MLVPFDAPDDPSPAEVPDGVADAAPEGVADDVPDDELPAFAPSDLDDFAPAPESVL